MKVLTVIAALLTCASSALAGDVPQNTLGNLGLGGMKMLADSEGMAVRGRASSFASVHGAALTFSQFATSDFKNFVVGSSGNQVAANGETTTDFGELIIMENHGVNLDLNLQVLFPNGMTFSGTSSAIAAGAKQISVMHFLADQSE